MDVQNLPDLAPFARGYVEIAYPYNLKHIMRLLKGLNVTYSWSVLCGEVETASFRFLSDDYPYLFINFKWLAKLINHSKKEEPVILMSGERELVDPMELRNARRAKRAIREEGVDQTFPGRSLYIGGVWAEIREEAGRLILTSPRIEETITLWRADYPWTPDEEQNRLHLEEIPELVLGDN